MAIEKLFHQVGDEVREYTADEYAQHKIDTDTAAAIEVARLAAETKAEADKAAILTKLGITADELRIALS